MTKEIEIPKDYEAKIDGNKVILVPKESEDERIRKAIIRLLQNGGYMEPQDKEKAFAWLEKQKEPHYTKRNALFDKCVKNCDPEVMKDVSDKVDEMLGKEQKPAEWSEDYREEDIQTRFAFYTYKDDPSVLYLSNVFVEEASRNHGFGTRILRAAEKVAEVIGATTISLKVKQDSPANAWYRKNGYGYVTFEDGYDWLEKNLEYMKPHKQEWSEEDEAAYNAFMCEVLNEKMNPTIEQIKWLMGIRDRLKSLRPPASLEAQRGADGYS